jgi:ABC-type sugar transport system ATPase subunit
LAILLISSDLPEVLALGDRVLVMAAGRLTAEFARGEATEERVMAAAARRPRLAA